MDSGYTGCTEMGIRQLYELLQWLPRALRRRELLTEQLCAWDKRGNFGVGLERLGLQLLRVGYGDLKHLDEAVMPLLDQVGVQCFGIADRNYADASGTPGFLVWARRVLFQKEVAAFLITSFKFKWLCAEYSNWDSKQCDPIGWDNF